MIMPSSYLDNKILALFMPIEDYIIDYCFPAAAVLFEPLPKNRKQV